MFKRFKSILWCKVQVTPKFGCDRLFFFLWVGRVAPQFSGEDTVQGKEEKRVKKKKRVVTFGRSAGRFGRDKTDTDRQAWTCGRVDVWWTDGGTGERGERETLEGRDVFGGSSG